MSLAETQELLSLLTQIDARLSTIEGKAKSLERELPEINTVVISVQQASRLTRRLASQLRKLGLPENVDETIRLISQLAYAVTMANMALRYLKMGTPYGLLGGVLSLLSSGELAIDFMMNMGS